MFLQSSTRSLGQFLGPLLLLSGSFFGLPLAQTLGADGANFGGDIAADGEFVVVGANNDDGSGAAYVFRRSKAGYKAIQRLVPQTSKPGFGNSVAIEGKTIVVGHSLENGIGVRTIGAAYVFESLDDSFKTVKSHFLIAPKPESFSGFGECVAIHRQTIAVGAPAEGNGAVNLFQKKGKRWVNIIKLTGLDVADDLFGAMFGYSLAMSDRYLVIGAPSQKVPDKGRSGAVYVYRRSDKGHVIEPPQMLTVPAAGRERLNQQSGMTGELGTSVAIHESTILAGAPGMGNGSAPQRGAALLYSAGADGTFPTEPTTVIIPEGAERDERAGLSVALNAEFVFVGAPQHSSKNGCVYIYARNELDKPATRKLMSDEASDVPPQFGRALFNLNEWLLVGAPRFNEEGRVDTFTLHKDGRFEADRPLPLTVPDDFNGSKK